MLEQYGVDVEDRDIALEMKLPYLFTCENGGYLAGPMLQSAEWFNLYLHPMGFAMVETELLPGQAPIFLKGQRTAMLGLQVEQGEKHAVVYVGYQNEKLMFLNNKWRDSEEPEQLLLSQSELLERIGSTVTIATIKTIPPQRVAYARRLRNSAEVMRQNVAQIRCLCAKEERVGFLRAQLNHLFRPLLLDGITMLELLGQTRLAHRFTTLQGGLLGGLRQDSNAKIILGRYLDVLELTAATEEYIGLIMSAAEHCQRNEEEGREEP
ncbi:hypothetical protein B5F98_11405 [Pseudoflavonifractor sp. An44]|nr:hypothetical protein B5F98_11405 [Pseudoflavonifractor sp. An44]